MLSTLRHTTFELRASDVLSMSACRRCWSNFCSNRVPLLLACTCVICSTCAGEMIQCKVVQTGADGAGVQRRQWTISCDAERRRTCTGENTIVARGQVASMRVAHHIQDVVDILRASARVGGDTAANQLPGAESEYVTLSVEDMARNTRQIVANINSTIADFKALLRADANNGHQNNYWPHLTVLFTSETEMRKAVFLDDDTRTLASFGINDNATIQAVVRDGYIGGELVPQGGCFTPGGVPASHCDQTSTRSTRGVTFSAYGHFLYVCDVNGKPFTGVAKEPGVWKLNSHDGTVVYKFDGEIDGKPMIDPSFNCVSPCGSML